MLACKDVSDNLHASHPGDIREYVGQGQVHLGERLLHVLNMRRAVLHQHLAMVYQTAQSHNLLRWSEGRTQQAISMQLLDPLAVQNIRLSPRNILQMPGIDQIDPKAVGFQDFVQWDPVHPGRFHRHRIDVAGFQPVSQAVEISREGRKGTHIVFIPLLRHCDPDFFRSDVDPSRIHIDLFQGINLSLLFLLLRFGHRLLLWKMDDPDPIIKKMSMFLNGVPNGPPMKKPR